MRPPLPAPATPEIKEFMQNRETLTQKMAQLRQQNSDTNGAPDPQVITQFQQDNAALLQRQKELSGIISEQQAQNRTPAPPQIPPQITPTASPQLKDYLAAHDQLMRDMTDFMKQHQTDDPVTRRAAIQQWRQVNAPRFQQLQEESHALAQTRASTLAMPSPNSAPTGK